MKLSLAVANFVITFALIVSGIMIPMDEIILVTFSMFGALSFITFFAYGLWCAFGGPLLGMLVALLGISFILTLAIGAFSR